MKLRQGQKVKLANPVATIARFYSNEQRGVPGAGGVVIDANLLHGDAWVFSVSTEVKPKGSRALIVFGSPDSNKGMWLDNTVLTR